MFNKKSLLHKIVHLLIFTLCILPLVGCNVSEQEAIDSSIQLFEVALGEDKKEANAEAEKFSYYLPSTFMVESEVNNNIVLENKDQTYILFVNPFESASSEVVYETTLSFYEKPIANKTLEFNDQFVFLLVEKGPSDNTYEVIVGIGGTKMTTITEVSTMKQSVQHMLDIIKSVRTK